MSLFPLLSLILRFQLFLTSWLPGMLFHFNSVFTAGECGMIVGPHPTKLPQSMGYWVWSTQRTCHFNLRFAISRRWQPAKARIGRSTIWRVLVLLHCCRNNMHVFFDNSTIEGEVSASSCLYLAMAMAMVTSWFFLGSFHRPIPVRYNWIVFACEMHSTSEFAKIVLSKCARDSCWIRHGGMNPSGNTLPGRRVNLRFDLWIYIST